MLLSRKPSDLIQKTKLNILIVRRLVEKHGAGSLLFKIASAWRGGELGNTLRRIVRGKLYEQWAKREETLARGQEDSLKQRVERLGRRPLISVAMPVFNPPPEYLERAIVSVINQPYPDWELCIADDCSTDPAIRHLLERYRASDARIKVVYRGQNGHISRSSNSALELACGEFVAFLDHDDLLSRKALLSVAEAVNAHPGAALIYSDEDKIDEQGRRYAPYFKSDFNYELLLAQNMICHLGVYRLDILKQIGGFRTGFEGSQDYDLALRVIERIHPSQIIHIPRVLYHWRAIEGSTARAPGEKDYAAEAMRKAAAEHLRRRNLAAEVLPAPEAPAYNRVRFARPAPLPRVSVIIAAGGRASLPGKWVESVARQTTYPDYEIVLAGGNADSSPLLNLDTREASGEILCFLDPGVEINTPDWLEEMVSFAALPEIGFVGPAFLCPDGRLQAPGRGIGGMAKEAAQFRPWDEEYSIQKLPLHQACEALNPACLVIRRELFEALGKPGDTPGEKPSHEDFFLRVRMAGYRNVWTPYAKIKLSESRSGKP